MTYDLLGRRKSLVNPDAGALAYDYDLAGHLVTRTDAKEQTVTYGYTYDQLVGIHADHLGSTTWVTDQTSGATVTSD